MRVKKALSPSGLHLVTFNVRCDVYIIDFRILKMHIELYCENINTINEKRISNIKLELLLALIRTLLR